MVGPAGRDRDRGAVIVSLLRSAGRIAVLAYCGVVMVWLLPQLVWPDARWIQVLLTWAMVWLVPAWSLVAVAVLGLFTGWRRPLLLVPVMALAVAHAPYLQPNWQGPDRPTDLRVMTFNVLNQNADVDALAELIERYQPDVVALQEVTERVDPALFDRLADTYPHVVVGTPTFGGTTAIASTRPLLSIEELDLGVDRPALIAAIDLDGREVVVASAHLYPSYYAWQAPVPEWPGSIDAYADAQQEQARRLVAALVARGDGPIVLGCDCNTRELNLTNDLLAAEFADGAKALGWRIGGAPEGTVHDRRFNRIDYHWYRGPIEVLGVYQVIDQAGSDHAAVIGDFALD